MDVNQQLSSEALELLLQKLNEKNEQVLDIVQILLMSAEVSENNEKAIIHGLGEIKKSNEEIKARVDAIFEKLVKLESDFLDLKSENRETEQKLTLMVLKLSRLENSVKSEDIEDYYALSQSLYSSWDRLDALTRKFIPIAEYLYSKLQKYDKPDYSPVILELCRAIENEFLLKIFRKYTIEVIERKGSKLDSFLSTDRASYSLQTKTNQFVKAISKAARTRKPEYSLGQMNTILSILKEPSTVGMSPLLRDFKSFLENNTEVENLLDSTYIKKVNDIVREYRNPSAHPEFMSITKANECREIMPERIDYLVECMNE